jgi:hypothetical protein
MPAALAGHCFLPHSTLIHLGKYGASRGHLLPLVLEGRSGMSYGQPPPLYQQRPECLNVLFDHKLGVFRYFSRFVLALKHKQLQTLPNLGPLSVLILAR